MTENSDVFGIDEGVDPYTPIEVLCRERPPRRSADFNFFSYIFIAVAGFHARHHYNKIDENWAAYDENWAKEEWRWI